MTESTQQASQEKLIEITPAAIAEIKRLIASENKPDLFLRLGVSAGGCSGMSYTMSLDDNEGEFDKVIGFDEVIVRIDLKALMYLKGSQLDFESNMLGGGFKFSNPNAQKSCSCGSSFNC